jgi:hypothetical protein
MAIAHIPVMDDPGPVEVIHLTQEEFRQGVQVVLDDMGMTLSQLKAQARTGDFVSHRAWELWMTVKNLGAGW